MKYFVIDRFYEKTKLIKVFDKEDEAREFLNNEMEKGNIKDGDVLVAKSIKDILNFIF